ncbi:hypothetical protein Ga0609869_002114 [Rhodovulum iodosum]|uniref:Uncharacterized protein n=1 Tax=Rhodovulum iodosum TaxID=68291 RepID=A0ABV3XTT9_9RHOB|nr:hypothetical protein [Rhodovulum robiginosum]RSK32197.1 hypothetical protein EJA01_13335 [Rhodovulum robiginosum]
MTQRIFSCNSTSRRGGAALALVSALMVAPVPAAAKGELPAVAAGSASVADWLSPDRGARSKAEAERKRNLAQALDTRHGRGTYICSASGFGQKSRCFAR